jgi:hypothetical protein
MKNQTNSVCDIIDMLQAQIHQNALDKGLWPEQEPITGDNTEEELENIKTRKLLIVPKIAFCHHTLLKALEAAINPIMENDKDCPAFSNFSIELADTVIRIMDLAEACGIPLGAAILAKMKVDQQMLPQK